MCKGTVAAGDGCAFKIRRPSSKEVSADVQSNYSRKYSWAYGFILFCDGNLNIMSVEATHVASTNDAGMCLFLVGLLCNFIVAKLGIILTAVCTITGMYCTSQVHHAIEHDKRLPSWAHVVLDEAFGCTDQELVAWSQGKNALSQEKDAYNFFLSAQRQSVERVFGVMNNRFGILWRPMGFSFDRYKLILVALCRFNHFIIQDIYILVLTNTDCRLHNYINQDKELAQLCKRHEMCHEDDILWKRQEMPDSVEMVMVSNATDSARPGRGYRSDKVSDRRVEITKQMKIHKCTRPKGSKEAQQIRHIREVSRLTCA